MVYGVFGGVSAAVSIGVLAAVAAAIQRPLLVPSLGPTAFLIFERPRLAAAAPRNIVLGHLIGIVCGEVALRLAGVDAATASLEHVTARSAVAAALSVALVMVITVMLGVPHPPAAATTLIVSLGLLTGFVELAALMVAVVLLAVQGFVIDRLVGLDYPVWAAPRQPPPPVDDQEEAATSR
jgi:CBS-domain-containing membrane protein